jgi:hypothetical protein
MCAMHRKAFASGSIESTGRRPGRAPRRSPPGRRPRLSAWASGAERREVAHPPLTMSLSAAEPLQRFPRASAGSARGRAASPRRRAAAGRAPGRGQHLLGVYPEMPSIARGRAQASRRALVARENKPAGIAGLRSATAARECRRGDRSRRSRA